MSTYTVNMVLTEIGQKESLLSNTTGIHAKISLFKVGTGTGYEPSQDDVDLHGDVLFDGIPAIRRSNIGVKLFVCDVMETSTAGNIGEIGLYTDTGVLYALGIVDPIYAKTTRFRLRFNCYMRIPVEGKKLNWRLMERPTLPRVDDYHQLPAANISGHHVFIVMKGHCGLTTPVLVTKRVMGDRWSIINGSMVYRGLLASYDAQYKNRLTVPSWFSLTKAENMDWGMLYVIDGAGKHQCMGISSGSGNDVVFKKSLDMALSVKTSIVEIWAGPGCCGLCE